MASAIALITIVFVYYAAPAGVNLVKCAYIYFVYNLLALGLYGVICAILVVIWNSDRRKSFPNKTISLNVVILVIGLIYPTLAMVGVALLLPAPPMHYTYWHPDILTF